MDLIKPNPYQPRRFFDMASLEELARSIREYGVLQPISVRIADGAYELVAGERRLRASRIAGLTSIPALVVNISETDSAILAIIENLQRQDLNFLEEAEGFQNLMRDYGFTQEELAAKISKSQSSIANKIRLLKLGDAVKKILLENNLTERHARALLKLEDEADQVMVLRKVTALGLTVKKTEELVDSVLEKKRYPQKGPAAPLRLKRCVRDIKIFTNTIKNAVDIMNDSGVAAEYVTEENDSGMEIMIILKY
jgi:ParB family chromosome partitioning protein